MCVCVCVCGFLRLFVLPYQSSFAILGSIILHTKKGLRKLSKNYLVFAFLFSFCYLLFVTFVLFFFFFVCKFLFVAFVFFCYFPFVSVFVCYISSQWYQATAEGAASVPSFTCNVVCFHVSFVVYFTLP